MRVPEQKADMGSLDPRLATARALDRGEGSPAIPASGQPRTSERAPQIPCLDAPLLVQLITVAILSR